MVRLLGVWSLIEVLKQHELGQIKMSQLIANKLPIIFESCSQADLSMCKEGADAGYPCEKIMMARIMLHDGPILG